MPSPSGLVVVFLTIALLTTTFTLYTHIEWDPHPNYISCISGALFGPHNLKAPSIDGATGREERDCGHDKKGNKVPLEIHIMSKCPDAKDCLEMMIAPAMEEVGDIVDFKMNFIGRPTQDGSISCMHGPSECLSNTIHLCASHLYPHTYFPFSLCLMHNYTILPKQSFIESCASQHNISFHKVNTCISSLDPDGGLELLKESVERSREVGAGTSCTVRVDEKVWCVRDGRKWKNCEGGTEVEDLVGKVKEMYKKRGGEDGEGPTEGIDESGGRGGVGEIVMRVGGRGLVKQTKEGLRKLLREEQIVWRG